MIGTNGCTLTNKSSIIEDDMNIKRAKYISKNIELNQELYFAAPESKMTINSIYNSSWFGSPLYSIFGTAAEKLEASYNRSIKIMMNLPLATHRSLIEPLSERHHLRRLFVKRFLQMTKSIRKSSKPILKTLLSTIEHDSRPVTGRNLRLIMLQSGRHDIYDIQLSDAEVILYHKLEDDDEWKLEMLKHLLEERELGGLDIEDTAWLDYLCCD